METISGIFPPIIEFFSKPQSTGLELLPSGMANLELAWYRPFMSDKLKKLAGEAATEFVKDGMKLGIGSGSTAEAFVRALAKKVDAGLSLTGVPTSERTRKLCEELSVPLSTLEDCPHLDLTIDGADEIDPELNLIKGGGGAHLREKIVAAASIDMIVIADDSKLVKQLGRFPLPIEVDPFGLNTSRRLIEELASRHGLSGPIEMRLTSNGTPFITDGGHRVFDASFGCIIDPKALALELNTIPGVVEHGIFTGLASRAIVTSEHGVRIVEPV